VEAESSGSPTKTGECEDNIYKDEEGISDNICMGEKSTKDNIEPAKTEAVFKVGK
jgi:hypothetical protein